MLVADSVKTGDIIMFKHDTPVIYYTRHGRNSSMHITKSISDSLQYWYHLYPYTHTGIVVVLDNPYVLHLSPDPYYDNYKKEWVIGKPVMSSFDELTGYKGCLYLHEYNNKVNGVAADELYRPDIHINNDVFNVLRDVALKGTGDGVKMSCADYVEYIQKKMGIINEVSHCANIRTVLHSGYSRVPKLIENAWSSHRMFKN